MRASILLVHLGESVPPYLQDCIHQLRLFNPPADARIVLVVEPCHAGLEPWRSLAETYAVELVFTDTLAPVAAHTAFRDHYRGDTEFRNGYWRHVKERFFYFEEAMRALGLQSAIAMEYDVLLYAPLADLLPKLLAYTADRIAMVMDNPTRGHPGFLVLPSPNAVATLNSYLADAAETPYDDMQLLANYAREHPEAVAFLPVLTPQRNSSKPTRTSLEGHRATNPAFLSAGFDAVSALFDSLVVGQYVGGIDPRNTDGKKVIHYENEGALYSIRELTFEWTRDAVGRWVPYIDGYPLATIHMHSKALSHFLSDRPTRPVGDYDVRDLTHSLDPNISFHRWVKRAPGNDYLVDLETFQTQNDGDVAISCVTHELLQGCLQPPICVDVGMDEGWWSRFCELVQPAARILGFEPNPTSFAALQRRFEHSPNVTLYPAALSDHDGTIPLHLEGPRSHSRSADPTATNPATPVACQSPATLFSVVHHVDIMKLDTEGHEPAIVRALKPSLSTIGALILEFTPHWYGTNKLTCLDTSIELLETLHTSYSHLYGLSRRGEVFAVGPIREEQLVPFTKFLYETRLQMDLLACRTPLRGLTIRAYDDV